MVRVLRPMVPACDFRFCRIIRAFDTSGGVRPAVILNRRGFRTDAVVAAIKNVRNILPLG